jgi:hypothetical protein
MPLFGLFHSKKDKKSANQVASPSKHGLSNASTVSEQDNESLWESVSQTTHSHVHESPGEPAPPTSRMKLPFRRKASESPVTSSPQTSPQRPPRMPNPYSSRSSVDMVQQLRPPKRSEIFASYDEGQRLSTRSLPTSSRTAPDTTSYQDMVEDTRGKNTQPKKSGGLLSWARERTKSKPSRPPVPTAESFNLRTFRHVRPESPSPQSEHPSSNIALEPPSRPRTRGDSVASESSQRISVAAFREAQARRSATSSPVPSFRPPSSADTVTTRALTPTRSNDPTRPHVPTRKSLLAESSTSSSSSSEEEESYDDAAPIKPLGRRKRTITRRSPVRAKTDIGHGQENDERQSAELRQPIMTHQSRMSNPQLLSGGSRISSNLNAYGKSRGSVSTSALDASKLSSVDFPTRSGT